MSFTFTIKGVENLQKAFADKQKEIQEVFKNDLNEGADIVVASARSKAPVLSGNLQRSINKNEVWVRGGIIDVMVGVEVNEIFSKADGYYARFIEKGTSRMKARPYLRPALNENKVQIQNKIEADLKEVIGNEGNL